MNHTVRTRDGGEIEIKGLTRQTAISLFCSECLGWETHPKDCTATKCPLFPYRRKSQKAYYSSPSGSNGSDLAPEAPPEGEDSRKLGLPSENASTGHLEGGEA